MGEAPPKPAAGAARPRSASTVVIARQPILDRSRHVVGFELLYRARPGDDVAHIRDAHRATTVVAASALFTWGLDTLVGDGTAFINVTPRFIADGTYRLFPSARLVLEVVEGTPVDGALLDGIAAARQAGYGIALDDFVPDGPHDDLLGHADFVKLEVHNLGRAELARRVDGVRAVNPRVALVAEKVETDEQYRCCAELGFALFQGYFLARPELLSDPRPQRAG